MNTILADNTVATMRRYILSKLAAIYDERESRNISQELFLHFSGWDRSEVILKEKERLNESEILQYHFALKRLLTNEPLQYVLGYAFFYGRRFNVNPSVLIPRPETEELVELIIKSNTIPDPYILDIGTGSGCIAVTLKKEIAAANVTAIDISKDALSTAGQNASALNASVDTRICDILHEYPSGEFDIIVSNPPYVLVSDKAHMTTRVKDHEPHLALFVDDNDPLIFYRRIIDVSRIILKKTGKVYCEMHESLEDEMAALMVEEKMAGFHFRKDHQGKTRFIEFSFT